MADRHDLSIKEAQQAVDEPGSDSTVRSPLHHHAREQGDVLDRGLAVRAEDQRVLEERQSVHQLLRRPAIRASRTASPWRPATTSASPTTPRGTACRRATPPICPRIRCRRGCRPAPIRPITTSRTSRISSPRCPRPGMTWRVYSESMNPGRDWRLDSVADDTMLAPDHLYPADSPVGAIGTPGLMLPHARAPLRDQAQCLGQLPGRAQLAGFRPQQPHHGRRPMGRGHEGGSERRRPDGTSISSGRTSRAATSATSISSSPTSATTCTASRCRARPRPIQTLQLASDCGKDDAILYRGDNYTDYLIRKIQASSGLDEHRQAHRDRHHVRRGNGHDRLQRVLRLESERRTRDCRPVARRAGEERRRLRLDRTDRALQPGQQGARHEHLRRPDEPAAGARSTSSTAMRTATSRSCGRCRTCSAWPIRATTGRT